MAGPPCILPARPWPASHSKPFPDSAEIPAPVRMTSDSMVGSFLFYSPTTCPVMSWMSENPFVSIVMSSPWTMRGAWHGSAGVTSAGRPVRSWHHLNRPQPPACRPAHPRYAVRVNAKRSVPTGRPGWSAVRPAGGEAPTGEAFRTEWIDFAKGIRVGHLEPHERITRIIDKDYPLPEPELRACSGLEFIQALAGVFGAVVPAMDCCMQVPLAASAAHGVPRA